MDLPFTKSEFLDVFTQYHHVVGIAPLMAAALALIVVLDTIGNSAGPSRLASGIIAALWIWSGGVYQLGFFSRINPAAQLFGALFIIQGGLFFWEGVVRLRLRFSYTSNGATAGKAGGLLVAYSLILYPVIGLMIGHVYPANATFGLPCPTTIFTLGVMLWARRPFPIYLILIPIVWAAIGASAAFKLGMWEDLGLPLAALLTVAMLLPVRKQLAYES